MLIMSGAIPLHPHISLWRGQGQHYLLSVKTWSAHSGESVSPAVVVVSADICVPFTSYKNHFYQQLRVDCIQMTEIMPYVLSLWFVLFCTGALFLRIYLIIRYLPGPVILTGIAVLDDSLPSTESWSGCLFVCLFQHWRWSWCCGGPSTNWWRRASCRVSTHK